MTALDLAEEARTYAACGPYTDCWRSKARRSLAGDNAIAHGRAGQAFAADHRLDTRFDLGSMNEMFTAGAVPRLVEQGKLSFETTVAEALPDYMDQECAARATVHHLLTHTSGIRGTIFGAAM